MMFAVIRKFREQFQPVTGDGCKSVLRQLYEVVRLGLQYRYTPREYYLYRFYQQDYTVEQMLRFLNLRTSQKTVQPDLNDERWVPLLGNKLLFQQHMASIQLPVPRLYGFYHPQCGFTASGNRLTSRYDLHRLLKEINPPSMVIKPVGGVGGEGVLVFDRIRLEPQLQCITPSGERYNLQKIMDHLNSPLQGVETVYDGFLIQQRLQQHPLLQQINPHTVNTVRLVTFLRPGGQAKVQMAALRLGREGGMIDSFSHGGGISVGVDPGTGVLKPGMIWDNQEWTDRHPDTGEVFEGLQLPFWQETVKVVCRANQHLPNLRSIGWDVGLTPDGPVLIEGNHNWGLMAVQIHTDGYLSDEVLNDFRAYDISGLPVPP